MKKDFRVIGGIVVLLFLFSTAHADRTVWYVHPDSALNTIQAGLDSCADNDIVLVGPGTYIENIIWPNTQGIHLISELGPDTTIIDGDNAGSVITYTSGVDTTTIIRGFTIQNGYAGWGGGIRCSNNSSPTIANNIITGNEAAAYIGSDGGGIYCWNSSPTIIDNTIMGNDATGFFNGNGGGIFCYGSSSIIINNYIIDNTAYNGVWFYATGGGIDGQYCSLTLKHNTIMNNTVESQGIYNGGGGICFVGCTATIDSCTISNNGKDGIYCPDFGSNLVINHSNITDNVDYGVRNPHPDFTVIAENNWWGDASGPYHPTLNPGGLGDTVSDYVDFTPWLQDSVEWVGIEEHEPSQPITTLLQISPNPFRDRVNIKFSMEHSAEVIELKIYDATGRLVRQWGHTTMRLSDHISWDGTDHANRKLPSGVYFLKLQAGDYSATEKLLLIR